MGCATTNSRGACSVADPRPQSRVPRRHPRSAGCPRWPNVANVLCGRRQALQALSCRSPKPQAHAQLSSRRPRLIAPRSQRWLRPGVRLPVMVGAAVMNVCASRRRQRCGPGRVNWRDARRALVPFATWRPAVWLQPRSHAGTAHALMLISSTGRALSRYTAGRRWGQPGLKTSRRGGAARLAPGIAATAGAILPTEMAAVYLRRFH